MSFVSKFESNWANIMSIPSGTHPVNPDMAHQFIENQVSSIRREAARDLIENTIYITKDETIEIVGKLIQQVYATLDVTKPVYFYTGSSNKSFYFFAVVSLYHIRNLGFPDPIFVDDPFTIEDDALPLIIIDDVSYTGSQLTSFLTELYWRKYRFSSDYPSNTVEPVKPNVHVLLTALTDFSLNNISSIPNEVRPIVDSAQGHGWYAKSHIKRHDKIMHPMPRIVLNYKKGPFHIHYLPERLYKPLLSKLGFKRYFRLTTFFSPFTTPNISLYTDHKIADDASTFKRTLTFGQIVPSNYNYKAIYSDEIMYSKVWQPATVDGGEELNELFRQEYKTGTNSRNYPSILLKELIRDDIIDREATAMTFYPFISNVTLPPFPRKLPELDYNFFMAPENCIELSKEERFTTTEKKCSTADLYLISYYYTEYVKIYMAKYKETFSTEYKDDATHELSMLSPKDINQLHSFVTSINEPQPFYKTGPSRMSGGKTKKKKRKTRFKTPRNRTFRRF